MALDTDQLTLANQALALLRQDIQLTDSNQNSTSVGMKCQNLVPLAIDEFGAIHSWSAGDDAYGDYKAALVYHIASVLAIPITGRQEDHKAFAELADIKARAARVKSLNAQLANSNDKILLALAQNFKVDDPQLATAWEVYTARSAAIKIECEKEILGAHEWDAGTTVTTDNLLSQAWLELCVSRLAVPCGLTSDVAKMYLDKYVTTLTLARIKHLNGKLKESNDPVLLTLMQNFKADDPQLATAWDMYTKRAASIKADSKNEILNSHNWTFDDLEPATEDNALAYQAYVDLCVSKLAIPCGLPADVAQMYLVKSQATLEKARAKDLLVGARKISDPDTNHVLALIRQIYDAEEKAKPLDIDELTERIATFKEAARKEVLSTYGWNFMRREKRNPPCNASADGRWSTTVPGDALRVLGCYHEDGSKVEYTIHGHKIIANAPPSRILYTVDIDEDISTYPILVKDAILLKIAENVATGLMASASGAINAHKVANLKNDYIRTVQEARTNDAKQVSVGESAWGRNYLADIMLGKRRGKWSAKLW